MNTPLKREEYTRELLKQLAYHLSYRKEAAGKEYICEISLAPRSISFEPDFLVCPNSRTRKASSKIPIITHVLVHHLHLSDDFESTSHVLPHGSLSYFIPGKYVYRRSVGGKRRRWFRVIVIDNITEYKEV